MSKIKVVSSVGDGFRWMAHEDGKTYHGVRHNLAPAIKRSQRLDREMNREGNNAKGWGYVGSANISMIHEWLARARYSWNDFATNRDGCKDRFWRWHEETNSKMCPGYKRKLI